jgi:enoyl-CoA hydratase/carnithine racemase
VLLSLHECLSKAQADASVVAIVVTGEGGKFSAGFDITHLAKQQASGSSADFGADVNSFLNKLLENGPKPTVAGTSTLCGALAPR